MNNRFRVSMRIMIFKVFYYIYIYYSCKVGWITFPKALTSVLKIIMIVLKSDHWNTDIYIEVNWDLITINESVKNRLIYDLPRAETKQSTVWNQHYALHDILIDWIIEFTKFWSTLEISSLKVLSNIHRFEELNWLIFFDNIMNFHESLQTNTTNPKI